MHLQTEVDLRRGKEDANKKKSGSGEKKDRESGEEEGGVGEGRYQGGEIAA